MSRCVFCLFGVVVVVVVFLLGFVVVVVVVCWRGGEWGSADLKAKAADIDACSQYSR